MNGYSAVLRVSEKCRKKKNAIFGLVVFSCIVALEKVYVRNSLFERSGFTLKGIPYDGTK